MLKSFHVPVGNLGVFFGKMSIQVLCPVFNQIICVFLWELNEILHQIHGFQIFSPIAQVTFLFCSLFVSFARQKLFSSMSCFTFIAFSFGVIAKKPIAKTVVKELFSSVSFKSSAVSGLPFKPLIHLN